MESTMNQSGPRIYVASLADYNAGRLVGKWIDAAQDAEAIHTEIQQMLRTSHEPIAEDWAIHDYEGFGEMSLSEFEDIEKVAEAARLIAEHGKMFAGLVAHFGGLASLDEAKQYMEEGYCGSFDRLADYAENFLEDCYGDTLKSLPDIVRYHIDFEGIARDMELSGDIFTIECDGSVHIFHGNI